MGAPAPVATSHTALFFQSLFETNRNPAINFKRVVDKPPPYHISRHTATVATSSLKVSHFNVLRRQPQLCTPLSRLPFFVRALQAHLDPCPLSEHPLRTEAPPWPCPRPTLRHNHALCKEGKPIFLHYRSALPESAAHIPAELSRQRSTRRTSRPMYIN